MYTCISAYIHTYQRNTRGYHALLGPSSARMQLPAGFDKYKYLHAAVGSGKETQD